ncbi:MAG TPA: carboxymuconolactone decarboxylase family protein [Candidatus Binataceae bacterium]|nr:carboxymuconolactone decarboxylase family protein [Candidatus Binataceae bacterium]
MARVPYLNREDLPEEYRYLFDRLTAESKGPVGNLFRALAHTPRLLRRFMGLGSDLRYKTELDPRLRELALLAVGRITGAEYEFVHHWNLALRAGVPREKLEALAEWETSPAFDDHDRAVIRYAIEATSNIKVSDSTWNAVKSFIDTRRLLELVENVAYYNMVVRVLLPCGVDLEPDAKKG